MTDTTKKNVIQGELFPYPKTGKVPFAEGIFRSALKTLHGNTNIY